MKMMLLPLLKGLTGITIFQLPTTYYLPSSGWREKISKIESAMERDNFLTPKEAQSFGLIDEVVEKRPVETGE